MSENVVEGAAPALSVQRPNAFDTIFFGGFAIGILDMLFAFTFYWLILGIKPLQIFQSVAAGVFGRTEAYAGGVKTFVLGLFLHFVVATCIATVYYLVSSRLPLLIAHPVPSGLIYGIIACLGMKFIVVPLSAIGRRPVPRPSIFITELIGHAFLVGLPVALVASRSAKLKKYS